MLQKKVLVIYTGGTIGMVSTEEAQALRPVELPLLRYLLPEIERLSCQLEYYSFQSPIDSSNMLPEVWLLLARIIAENYERYDGFVILHGTDTMAYTASMLSFLLEGLTKPVVLTGAQLPINMVRTDARENLINALEIAGSPEHTLPEVAICFGSDVLRGNRTIKYSSEKFHAFVSPKFPPLIEAGVHLAYFTQNWLPLSSQPFIAHRKLDAAVGLLKFYPGISQQMVRAVLNSSLKAVVLETYGTGNLPEFSWLVRLLEEHIAGGQLIVNISQCPAGKVEQGRYETSQRLLEVGVVSGQDMTTEAALTKLMYLLGRYEQLQDAMPWVGQSLRGELTAPERYNFVQNVV